MCGGGGERETGKTVLFFLNDKILFAKEIFFF